MSRQRLSKAQFLEHLKRKIKTAGTQREMAAQLGVSQQYLSDVLKGRREPGPKLAEAMGFGGREIVFTSTP